MKKDKNEVVQTDVRTRSLATITKSATGVAVIFDRVQKAVDKALTDETIQANIEQANQKVVDMLGNVKDFIGAAKTAGQLYVDTFAAVYAHAMGYDIGTRSPVLPHVQQAKDLYDKMSQK